MDIRKDRILRYPLFYLFFVIVAASMHAYFIYYNVYFHEVCCDSLKQMAQFYSFLNQQFSQGHFFWSWENGLGGDLFNEFLYYFSTSPFFWLTMIFDISTIRDVFEMSLWMSIFKLSLAMIFMYHLLRYGKRSQVASIIGSLIYGGSLYFPHYSIQFYFMVDGMVWLPLLILGYERLVDQKKKGLFIFTVFLITCSNFYLAYINSIYLFFYAVMKYFISQNTYGFRDFIRYYLKMISYYLVGVLLSAFALLPAVITYLRIDRFYYDLTIPLLFKWDIYKLLAYNLFFYLRNTSFVIVFPIIVYFLLLCTFLISEKGIRVRSLFLGFIGFLALIPYSYSFFNGFSSMQFRWLYLVVFTVAQVSAFTLDVLWQRRGSNRLIPIYLSIAMLLLIGMLIFKQDVIHAAVEEKELLILCLGALIFLILLFCHKLPQTGAAILLIGMVWFNIVMMNEALFRSYLGDPNQLKVKQESLLASYPDPSLYKMFAEIQQRDPTFHRMIWDQITWNHVEQFNSPLIYGYRGFSTYNSLLSGTVHKFIKREYNTLQENQPSLFRNLDHRLYMETALANKYVILPKSSHFQPYGYSFVNEAGPYRVWKNNFTLPIGFMYDSVVDRHTFTQMNVGQRDQLLLRAAVVEKDQPLPLLRFNPKHLDVKTVEVDAKSIRLKNATLKGHLLKADEDAELVIPPVFTNEKGELLVDIKLKKSNGENYKLYVNDQYFRYYGNRSTYNYPKEEIIFNRGHQHHNNPTVIKISPGEYELKGISLILNSYRSYETAVKERLADSLQDVRFTEKSVSGKVDVRHDGILFLSIPYNEGWHFKVDGVPVDKLKVNYAFTGVFLPKGVHRVEANYTNPYFQWGASISFTTLLVVVVYGVKRRVSVSTSKKSRRIES